MSEVHVFATVSAAAGKEDELRDALVELVKVTHTEPGVVQYILHEDPQKLGNFYVFEVYKDKAAMDSHMASAHLAAAFAKAGPLISGPPSITPTVVVAGK
jgi:quinol monooxygenase YgiN